MFFFLDTASWTQVAFNLFVIILNCEEALNSDESNSPPGELSRFPRINESANGPIQEYKVSSVIVYTEPYNAM